MSGIANEGTSHKVSAAFRRNLDVGFIFISERGKLEANSRQINVASRPHAARRHHAANDTIFLDPLNLHQKLTVIDG